MNFTGERLVTGIKGDIVELHLHRYALALELVANKSVLDIASGEGYGSNLLAHKANSVIGVDIVPDVVAFAQTKYKKSNLNFKVGSADKIPLDDASVDVVVSFETIEHHDKHHEMLKEIKRVLRPNGVLILSSPDKLNYTDIPKYKNSYHVKELYREEFKSLIQSYFNHVKLLYQNMIYSSIIVPEDGLGNDFKEYSGDFSNINTLQSINYPVYNICIASNQPLNDLNYPKHTIFDCTSLLKEILGREGEVYSSKTYKAGKLITFPIHLFRKLFKK